MSRSRNIKSKLEPIKNITEADKHEMYHIFIKYYDNVSIEIFLRDFNKKEHVCILRNITNNAVVGFSTLTRIKVFHNGSTNTAIFSGDTVVEKKYWGSTAIHLCFLRYLYWQRLRHPFSHIFWFLITKGYKTYLLMANNFDNYYPRYDREFDPRIRELTKLFCHSLYPGVYDEKTGLLAFGEGYEKLKHNVAEIDDEMRKKYPRIAFFEKVNPTWRDGTELPCLVEISWLNLIKSSVIFILRKCFKRKKGSKISVERLPQVSREEYSSIAQLAASVSISADVDPEKVEEGEYVA